MPTMGSWQRMDRNITIRLLNQIGQSLKIFLAWSHYWAVLAILFWIVNEQYAEHYERDTAAADATDSTGFLNGTEDEEEEEEDILDEVLGILSFSSLLRLM